MIQILMTTSTGIQAQAMKIALIGILQHILPFLKSLYAIVTKRENTREVILMWVKSAKNIKNSEHSV